MCWTKESHLEAFILSSDVGAGWKGYIVVGFSRRECARDYFAVLTYNRSLRAAQLYVFDFFSPSTLFPLLLLLFHLLLHFPALGVESALVKDAFAALSRSRQRQIYICIYARERFIIENVRGSI